MSRETVSERVLEERWSNYKRTDGKAHNCQACGKPLVDGAPIRKQHVEIYWPGGRSGPGRAYKLWRFTHTDCWKKKDAN